MQQYYYLIFALAVFTFVIVSFIRQYFFWKRVLKVKNVSELSTSDQKQYEKYRTKSSHDTLATQKIDEVKLLLVTFLILTVISVFIYWFLSTRL